MKVEARYCDACGVRIAPDDLREGEAVQLDESVFYCKDCKAKHEKPAAPAQTDEAAKGRARPSSKRLSSSRRLITRRLASGRLARSKSKLPPALTTSGESPKKERLEATERLEQAPDKKKREERAKVRAKIEQEKKTTKAAGAVAPAKAAPAPEKAAVAPEKTSAPAEASTGEAPKKKKKKKKKKTKKAKAAAPADAEKAGEKKPDAEKAEEKKSDAGKADESKPEAIKAAADGSGEEKPADGRASGEEARASEAQEKTPEGKPTEKETAREERAPEKGETKKESAEKAVAEKVVAEKGETKKESAEKAVAEKAVAAKTEPEPSSAASKTEGSEAVSESEDEKPTKKAADTGTEVAEKKPTRGDRGAGSPPAKKTKRPSGEEEEVLDELEEISEDAPAKDKKKDAPEKAEKPEKTEKPEKAEKPEKEKKKRSGEQPARASSDDGEAATEKGKLKTASKTRSAKRLGSKAAVEAAQADPDEIPKKPKLPMVPIMALGGLVLALVVAVPFLLPKKDDKPVQVAKRDPEELLNDLRSYAQQCPDPDEVSARWEGMRDAIDESKKGDCDNEAQAARARLDTAAKGKLDDLNQKIDQALQAKDFDGALKAIADYPAALRASRVWRDEGPSREAELVRRRDAYVMGQALLAEAKRVWEADHSKDALDGLYAAFPDEYRSTAEGKAVADELQNRISEATHAEIAESGTKAAVERTKNAEANYEKSCANRARTVADAQGDFHPELGTDLFDWQVRPDLLNHAPLGENVKVVNGKLVMKNDEGENLYLGKSSRSWSHFVIEFKIKVSKGTKAWFLGKVSAREHDLPSWDEIPITASAVKAKGPHVFQGIPDDTEVTLQFRYIKKSWDVVVNGKDVYLITVGSANPVGGFGFECDKGTIEISDVRAKVLGRKTASGEEE